MNTSPASKVGILADRAHLFEKVRAFFKERGVLEVDCPALTQASPIDLHIDVMPVPVTRNEMGFLHTSPEYGMKRLLSQGIGDIYQMSHVFRAGEVSPLHNPEFTMLEWYRLGFCFEEMIAETLEVICLCIKNLPVKQMTYRQVFKHYLDIDTSTAHCGELLACAKAHHLDIPQSAETWDKDTLLQLLLGLVIEPQLGRDELFVLAYFPSSQAALAKTVQQGSETVACRFEVYYQGIELANGYHELTDAKEQRRRLEASSAAREQAGKEPLKIDEHFLRALEEGLPDCCGVAVGFDRLMLLRHGKAHLKDVLPFAWDEA